MGALLSRLSEIGVLIESLRPCNAKEIDVSSNKVSEDDQGF